MPVLLLNQEQGEAPAKLIELFPLRQPFDM